MVLSLLEDGGLKTFLTLTLGLLISDESKGLGLTGETSLMIALPLDLVLPPFFGEDRISGRAVGKDCTVTGLVTNTVVVLFFSTTNSILELNYSTHDCFLVYTRIYNFCLQGSMIFITKVKTEKTVKVVGPEQSALEW